MGDHHKLVKKFTVKDSELSYDVFKKKFASAFKAVPPQHRDLEMADKFKEITGKDASLPNMDDPPNPFPESKTEKRDKKRPKN